MGNGLCRKSNSIEERLTKPQRLVRQLSNVDYRKLRKLIISQKLAPCYDGFDDSGSCSDELNDLEECPICFIFYPSLNRSRCCTKGICTECFLQMKPASTMRPALCPFCKTVGYAVEYRGARTEEEKKLEQAEKQKVIEAKIRMQSQESHERAISPHPNVQVPQPMRCSEQLPNGDFHDGRGVEESLLTVATDMDGSPEYSRHPEFNLDLDEIILMEAIWQSMKDIQKNSTPELSEPSVTCTMEPVNCSSNQQPLENPLEECEERDQRTHPTSPEFHNLESGIRCEDLSYTHEGANAINSSHQLSCVVSDAFSLHFSADVNR